jgi:hypothetical protein
MSLTLQMLINNGLLEELASCFTNETAANIVLTSIKFPVCYRPNFAQAGPPMDFWLKVCEQIEKGLIPGGFEELLAASARQLPGNKILEPFNLAQAASAVPLAAPPSGNYSFPLSVIRHHDAFISYSQQDQDMVKCIAGKLKKRNVRVWLDEWELIPGSSFAGEIEQVLAVIPAVVVFCGTKGFGPWQRKEVEVVYDRAFRDKCRLIPVMLPGVGTGDLPPFLKTFNATAINDCSDDTAIVRLASAIKGKILRTL